MNSLPTNASRTPTRPRRGTCRWPSLLAWTFALAATSASGADGDLDPTFASGGAAFANWGAEAFRDASVTVDSTGAVFVAATARSVANNRLFAVAKFRPDGSLDTAFGFQGLRTVDFDLVADGFDLQHGVFALLGGAVMLLGEAEIPGNASAPAMVRLTAAGNADTTFGAGGKRVIINSPWAIEGLDLVATTRQRDGKFVFGGWCVDCPWPRGAVVLRVDANGAPDASFGTNGWASLAVPERTRLNAVAVDRSGRIALAGFDGDLANEPHAPVLARFLPDGSADLSFGVGTGYVRLTNVPAPPPQGGWLGRALAADRDGSLLLSLTIDDDLDAMHAGIVRVRENGTLDTAFGNAGLRPLDLENGVVVEAIDVRSDGRIMAAGSINHTGGGLDVLVTRLRADGSLDPGFAGNGLVRHAIDPQIDRTFALTSSAGRPVIAGVAQRGDSWDGFAVRLTSDLIFADGIE
ncbi:MAG: hypothetical protein ABIR62_12320 [Dokdonella sp.]|uniref:hypothetical protein n=1 Tax=Dokdonella sp. TaxID=2291710 RepID=UPI0032658903